MCVQRIQDGKLTAKKNGAPVVDGAIQTACAKRAQPTPLCLATSTTLASEVKTNSKNNRSYHALEEVGIQPNIFYMTKVRNTESNEA